MFGNNATRPTVILCEDDADRTPLKILNTIYGYNFSPRLNEISECSFSIPYTVNDKDITRDYELLADRDRASILIKDPFYGEMYGWVKVNEMSSDNIRRDLNLTVYSSENMLADKSLTEISGTFQLYNPSDLDNSIVYKLLETTNYWEIGTVDPVVAFEYRTFDISNKSVYEVFKSNIQSTYNCLVEFDTVNRLINISSAIDYGTNKGLLVTQKNLIKEFSKKVLSDEVVTKLGIFGGSGISINSVNPSGKSYIWDISYYLDRLSQTTQDAYTEYQLFLNGNGTEYTGTAQDGAIFTITLSASSSSVDNFYVGQEIFITSGKGKNQLRTITGYDGTTKIATVNETWDITYLNNVPDATSVYSVREYKDKAEVFNVYLVDLETLYTTLQTKQNELADLNTELGVLEDAFQSQLSFDGSSFNLATITGQISSKQAEVDAKQVEIDDVNEEIDDIILVEVPYLNNVVDENEYFTSDQLKEIDPFLIESTYQDESFVIGDSFTYEEEREIYDALYSRGLEVLESAKTPLTQFSMDVADFLKDVRFEGFIDKFNIGDLINVNIKGDGLIEIRLLGYDHDWDSNSLTLIFSDRIKSTSEGYEFQDLLNASVSTSKTTNFERGIWNAYVDSGERTALTDYITNELDASVNAVVNATSQEVIFDKYGFLIRKLDGVTTYLPEQIRIINNKIVFTDDNWSTAKAAIGQITNPTNPAETVFGVVAEALIGTIVIAENLLIENSSGTFEVTADGVVITDLDLSLVRTDNASKILINTTDGIEIWSDISDGNGLVKRFYVDTNGDLLAKNIKATNATFSGAISASTIDIGSGDFTVDINGNVVANSLDINGGSIDIGANFGVDSSGNMTATNATFSGDITGSTISGGKYYNSFKNVYMELAPTSGVLDVNFVKEGATSDTIPYSIYDNIGSLNFKHYGTTYMNFFDAGDRGTLEGTASGIEWYYEDGSGDQEIATRGWSAAAFMEQPATTFTGTWINSDGDTVTVINGIIKSVA